MYTAPQIIYSSLLGLPEGLHPGSCRLCGGKLVGEPVLWTDRARENWTSESLCRDISSNYICEPCNWAYARPRIMTADMGANRGFMATISTFKGFSAIDDILSVFQQLPDETMVWLIKTGVIQKQVLFLPSVSYPPYLRVMFIEGDSNANELVFKPEQLFEIINELAEVSTKKRSRYAKKAPIYHFASWMVNARAKEEKERVKSG